MCGILAIFGIKKGADSLRQTALHLSRLLRHRGPDWSGVYCEGNTIICHERLAIVGVDDGGQPLYNKTRTLCLSVNAEIYNHRQIRSQLSDKHVWLTHSDCECLLHAYAEHGDNFMSKLNVNGMYAFVLYDIANDCYIAARDPIGIIPLYIGHGRDGSVWFASEMKALQNHCEQFEIFPPGHIYNSKTRTTTPFYTPRWLDMNVIPTRKIGRLELREAFEASVVRHMMADVPCGVLLSGGLDSSLVASIASRHAAYRTEDYADVDTNLSGGDMVRKRSADFPRLHSFCIGLAGSPDIKAAEKVAELLGTKHHSYIFTIQEGLDAISDVIFHLETYDVTSIRAATPMYLMSRKIKASGVKMVLSGEGSDEMFGGYLYFHKAPNKEEFHKELVRKLKMLHMYDCLRANKSPLAWGVEARVPFLDREFLELVMEMDPEQKICVDAKGKPRIEKHVLREAFDVTRDNDGERPSKRLKLFTGDYVGKPYLPESILWRQKEQFSDGVGYNWIDTLRSVANEKVSDEQLEEAKYRFPYNTPTTKEGYYYRSIFAQHFPSECAAKTVPGGPSVACSTATAIEWDASFKNRADPSGRAVAGVHVDAIEANVKLS